MLRMHFVFGYSCSGPVIELAPMRNNLSYKGHALKTVEPGGWDSMKEWC